MSDPSVILETPIYHVNLTVVFAVITICMTGMGTLVAIFRRKVTKNDIPGQSQFCIQKKADFDRIEASLKEQSEKMEKLKDDCNRRLEELRQSENDTDKDVGILKSQSTNSSKVLDDMKQDVKDVANKLDDLLKQLLDWMS